MYLNCLKKMTVQKRAIGSTLHNHALLNHLSNIYKYPVSSLYTYKNILFVQSYHLIQDLTHGHNTRNIKLTPTERNGLFGTVVLSYYAPKGTNHIESIVKTKYNI